MVVGDCEDVLVLERSEELVDVEVDDAGVRVVSCPLDTPAVDKDVVVDVDLVVAVDVDVEEVLEKAMDKDVVVEVDLVVAVEVDVEEVLEKAVDKDVVVE
eukprot:3622908-Amphidinium_carterae.1